MVCMRPSTDDIRIITSQGTPSATAVAIEASLPGRLEGEREVTRKSPHETSHSRHGIPGVPPRPSLIRIYTRALSILGREKVLAWMLVVANVGLAGVMLVEQPLPAGNDAALAEIARPIPVCADESAHDRASLALLAGKYDAVNIKLDKTGGLTEALAMAQEAERRGFLVMVGCMVATSLAMAPAMLLTARARFVDLDGPLLLAKDRPGGMRYEGSLVYPADATFWG